MHFKLDFVIANAISFSLGWHLTTEWESAAKTTTIPTST